MNTPKQDNSHAQRGASLVASTGGFSSAVPDMADDPEYQAWVESMAKHCRCRSSDVPCDGVLAGGLCDEIDDSADGWDYDDNEL